MREAINDTFPEPNRRLLQRCLIDNFILFSFNFFLFTTHLFLLLFLLFYMLNFKVYNEYSYYLVINSIIEFFIVDLV